jgi:predicted small metal-binding protein
MNRKYIDCREFPADIKCSVALAADSEAELMEAAVQHAVAVHGYQDTPELRKELKSCFHDGTPPLKAPKPAAT